MDGLDADAPAARDNPPPLPQGLADSIAVSHNAPEPASPASPVSASTPLAGEADAAGEPFDPGIHEVKPDGTGRKKKDGTWRLKRGRGATAPATARAYNPKTEGAPVNPNQAVDAAAFKAEQEKQRAEALAQQAGRREMAGHAASLTVVAGITLGGEDFAATEAEIKRLSHSYETYFNARNVNVTASPEFIIVGALAEYVAPRLGKKPVKDRMNLGWSWIKAKFSGIKNRRGNKVTQSASKEEGVKPRVRDDLDWTKATENDA